MSALVFLIIAAVISTIGSMYLWLRNRKPRTLTSSIDDFHREMQALAPDQGGSGRRRTVERP